MRNTLIYIFFILLFTSCNKNIYGIYNTKYSMDKSSFLQVKINPNNTVEKIEIHTIRIESKGIWVKNDDNIICYFQPTETGFPADILILKIIGKKMFLGKNVKDLNKKFYLKKYN